MPTISVITPTIGRPSLAKMLSIVVPQLVKGDEVLVVGDGPTPAARKIVESFKSSFIKYEEHGPIWNYGNPQRNLAMSKATGQFLMFVDDDDPVPGNVGIVKKAVAAIPDRPHMFKISIPGRGLFPNVRKVACGIVSGQGFVPPNIKRLLGKWSGRYVADFDFISSTAALYGEGAIIWHDDIICEVKPAGRGTIGKEKR